jgi:hypothetical protein
MKPKPGQRKPIVTRTAAERTEKVLVAVMLLLMILILLAKAAR